MPHLIGDLAEGDWKNSLFLKVIGLERREDRRSSPCRTSTEVRQEKSRRLFDRLIATGITLNPR